MEVDGGSLGEAGGDAKRPPFAAWAGRVPASSAVVTAAQSMLAIGWPSVKLFWMLMERRLESVRCSQVCAMNGSVAASRQ